MEDFSLALIWLGFFASIFLGWFFYLQARNKERMALIEKNADVTEIFKVRQFSFRFPWLKLGMILTGVGFGLVVILILPIVHVLSREVEEMLMTGCTLFFGGLGIVIAHFIEKPKGH